MKFMDCVMLPKNNKAKKRKEKNEKVCHVAKEHSKP